MMTMVFDGNTEHRMNFPESRPYMTPITHLLYQSISLYREITS